MKEWWQRRGTRTKLLVWSSVIGFVAIMIIAIATGSPSDEADSINTSAGQTQQAAQPTKVVPTSTTMPTPTLTTVGLGISRHAIQSVYEGDGLDFVFKSSLLADGQARVMGESTDGIATVELIGPEHDITQATLLFVASTDPNIAALNAVYMLGLMGLVMPNWESGIDWVNDNLEVAIDKGKARTKEGGAEVEITAYEAIGLISLSIKSDG